VRGEGVARVEPPYRARLDLFRNMETVSSAILVDDVLREANVVLSMGFAAGTASKKLFTDNLAGAKKYLADLEAWYRRWYAPNNATVVVVGDVEPEAVHALAVKHFGTLAPSEIEPELTHRRL